MITFLVIIHVICCLGLITTVLLQAGKGAGLASTFGAAAVESALGAEASDFLKKMTTVMAVVFMLTSLALAFMTSRKSSSVVKPVKPSASQSQTVERRVKVTPQGEEVEEKIIPGLEGKSKEELQKVLKEITKDLPLGEKAKADTQTAVSTRTVTGTAQMPSTTSQVQDVTQEESRVLDKAGTSSQEPLKEASKEDTGI